MPNSNGLTAGSSTFQTGDPNSYLYVRRNPNNGDSTIDGDLTVEGDLFVQGDSTLPTITAIDVSQNPVYIKNPYNLGQATLARSAVVVEGGANRADVSGDQVSFSVYKPLTRGTVDHVAGEQLASVSFWGKDTAAADFKYGEVRSVITDPTSNNHMGRINFICANGGSSAAPTMFQIDGSLNVVRTINAGTTIQGARLHSLADISANTSIVAGTTITAGTNVSAGPAGTVIGRQMLVAETTVGGGLGGTLYQVDLNNAGRVNSDGSKMMLNGLAGSPSFPVELNCTDRTALRATTDAGSNINVQIGSAAVPRGGSRLQNVDASGSTTYWPSLMKTSAAVSGGATVSFTNTAELLNSAVSVDAPYTGYYMYMAQFRASTIGNFDEGTDQITFYADISGGSVSPAVGSIHDINAVGSGSDLDYTFSGYVQATAGDIINMYHVDVGVITITNGVLFVLWKYLGAGTGLL